MGAYGRFKRQFTLFCILCAFIAYVAADAVRGTHGLLARHRIETRSAALQSEIAALKQARTQLERDAELLGAKSTSDPSLLDEEARSLLDLAKPTDIVIADTMEPRR